MKIINYNKILLKLYLSSKLSNKIKNNNLMIFKVNKKCNKFQIITAFKQAFNVKVNKIRTLIVKKSINNKKNKVFYIKIWKKVYIYLDKKTNINTI